MGRQLSGFDPNDPLVYEFEGLLPGWDGETVNSRATTDGARMPFSVPKLQLSGLTPEITLKNIESVRGREIHRGGDGSARGSHRASCCTTDIDEQNTDRKLSSRGSDSTYRHPHDIQETHVAWHHRSGLALNHYAGPETFGSNNGTTTPRTPESSPPYLQAKHNQSNGGASAIFTPRPSLSYRSASTPHYGNHYSPRVSFRQPLDDGNTSASYSVSSRHTSSQKPTSKTAFWARQATTVSHPKLSTNVIDQSSTSSNIQSPTAQTIPTQTIIQYSDTPWKMEDMVFYTPCDSSGNCLSSAPPATHMDGNVTGSQTARPYYHSTQQAMKFETQKYAASGQSYTTSYIAPSNHEQFTTETLPSVGNFAINLPTYCPAGSPFFSAPCTQPREIAQNSWQYSPRRQGMASPRKGHVTKPPNDSYSHYGQGRQTTHYTGQTVQHARPGTFNSYSPQPYGHPAQRVQRAHSDSSGDDEEYEQRPIHEPILESCCILGTYCFFTLANFALAATKFCLSVSDDSHKADIPKNQASPKQRRH